VRKLKRIKGHVFRLVREDGELGEDIVFELAANGRALRFKQHSNYSYRLD
jgi:hypothetical protein